MIRQNRGARIRTGDLCDPNAALYRTEPRPVCDEQPPSPRFGALVADGGLPAEAEGLEPPSARARRISSAVPYQLGLRLLVGRSESGSLALTEGVGWASGWLAPSSAVSGIRAWRRACLRLDAVRIPFPQFARRSRREWDSNPRGPWDQRLSRAPLLAAQPSLQVAPPGIEPGLF